MAQNAIHLVVVAVERDGDSEDLGCRSRKFRNGDDGTAVGCVGLDADIGKTWLSRRDTVVGIGHWYPNVVEDSRQLVAYPNVIQGRIREIGERNLIRE